MLSWIEIFLAILMIVFGTICFSFGQSVGKREIINTLCNKSEYNFCQKISEYKKYKLSEDF